MNVTESTVSEGLQGPRGVYVQATLPIEDRESLWLESAKAREFGAGLAAQYCAATPYPHIVIDDFLPHDIAEAILSNFPTLPKRSDVMYQDKLLEYNKRQIQPDDCSTFARRVFSLFNSAAVLDFLGALTGIEGLLPDPYFDGGGFHEISNGGRLGVHADFRIHGKLQLRRRLNLLIYLNKNWQESYGGHFEMWDKAIKQRAHRVSPLFNRCVIFNTEKDSWHGHPEPLNTPTNVTRKSMALYYYTASQRIQEEIPRHSTVFVKRPGDAFSLRIVLNHLRTHLAASELLPPIIYRNLRSLRERLKGRPTQG
jgi:Rps23 Pro-64 3,4-dihydroxylase Tpa1-like proline 4-hydroxylase